MARPRRAGIRAANEVALTPELRALLRRRVTRQERREHNPAIAMLRQRRKGLKRGLRQEIAAIQGTADLATEAVTGIPLRGLRGSARRQVAEDLAARAAGIQGSVPLLAAEARSGYREERAAATDDILAARIAKKQDIESSLSSALAAARTDAQSTLKARATRRRAKEEDRTEKREVDEGLRNAVIAAGDALTAWDADSELKEVNPLRSPEDWRRFAVGLTRQYEGVTLRDAMRALRRVAGANPAVNPRAAGPPRPE